MNSVKFILIAMWVLGILMTGACRGTPGRDEGDSPVRIECGKNDSEVIIGTATMQGDRTIVLRLWSGHGSDEPKGQILKTYPPDHPDYEDIIEHVGGLRPGETKNVPSWSD